MAAPGRAGASTTPHAAPGRKKQANDTTATANHQASAAANGVGTAEGVEGMDELTALYPPGQPPQRHRRGYIDDTLALPPHHLLHETPPPEALAAARPKASERGLLPPAGPRARRMRCTGMLRARSR